MKAKKTPMSLGTVLLLVAAVGLLIFSGIGGARAALNYISDTVAMRISTSDIGLTMLENGKEVGDGVLLSGMEETIAPGKSYDEVLTLHNSGAIDEYVRITLYRYWTVGENKQTTLTPELIEIGELGEGWAADESASTPERTVYYYTKPLVPGESTTPLCESLRLSSDVLSSVTVSEDGTAATYDYNDTSFVLQAEADGVQARNAQDAILSAWGLQADVDNSGKLTLKQ